MDDVQCNEDDKNISNCRARLMSHNCDHGEDIWLQCKGKFTKSKKQMTRTSNLLLQFPNMFFRQKYIFIWTTHTTLATASNTEKISTGKLLPTMNYLHLFIVGEKPHVVSTVRDAQ